MPAFQNHAIGGILLYCIGSIYLGITMSLENGISCFAGAILPDILEPAFHWTHRDFFHSWLSLGIMAIVAYISYISQSYLIFSGSCGYVLHLLMDATTEMGLPSGFD